MLLMIGVLAPAPASAQVARLSVALEGEIHIGCTLSGVYFDEAGLRGAPRDLEAGEIGQSVLSFDDFNNQEIGQFTLICNSATASITIDTLNDFRLNRAGEPAPIPFTLSIPEEASLSGGFSRSTTFTTTTAPGSEIQRSLLVNIGTLSAIDFAPGLYSDVIQIEVVPNA